MARKSTDFIVIHCSATPPTHDIGAKDIDRWHRAQGWLGIGYHYVIRRDGTLETGRKEWDPGAHAKGYNHNSIGICIVGGTNAEGKPENNFTREQWSTLADLMSRLRATYPAAKVIGHNEISNKACPSFNVQEWLTATL